MRHYESLVVFSHLRWDGVFQRPQHLLSRMAARRRVLFIEEPVFDPDQEPHWEIAHPTTNITTARPHTPDPAGGFSEAQLAHLRPMVKSLVARERLGPYVIWMYTPMALPLAAELSPQAVVYDCMDELAQFRGAPADMVRHETELLAWADVVFTGGQSLFQARRSRHRNIHCFPSSVDAQHFKAAGDSSAVWGRGRRFSEPADQAEIPHPRLGFYGVIDERINPELLDTLARAHPTWQLIMIGPIVKIDPATLPRHANIHYLGQRAYDQLPNYIAGWDVALMPFALNEATKYISPTKTLEYMAAEKMIVSTPITDVVRPFGDIVYLGHSPDMFVVACENALKATPVERASRIKLMRETLAHTSWQSTVREMESLIQQALEDKSPVPLKAPATRLRSQPQSGAWLPGSD